MRELLVSIIRPLDFGDDDAFFIFQYIPMVNHGNVVPLQFLQLSRNHVSRKGEVLNGCGSLAVLLCRRIGRHKAVKHQDCRKDRCNETFHDSWEVYRHAKDQLKLIRVAEKPRITKESFDNWYANQTLFHIVPEISLIEEENTVVSDVIPEQKEYVSIREAAECLGISEKRVYRLIQDGTLNGKKIGKAWFIRYADIASYEKED